MEEGNKSESNSITHKCRNNPWMVSTIVLGIFVLIVLGNEFAGGLTGSTVSEDRATQIFLNAMESQGANSDDIEITDISIESGLYVVNFDYKGEAYPIPYYITQDGKLIGMMGAVEEEEPETSYDIPKKEVPEVELFVMSYCPYGTQAEKGILPVAEILGDKIDFRIRYVYYSMHGEKEIKENLREYCIQENEPDKFLNYMNCFLEGDGVVSSSGYITEGNDVDSCLSEAGIDKTALGSCMDEADKEFSVTKNLEDEDSWLSGYYPLFDVDKELNEEYEIGGSPTLIINGVTVSSARDPASYLDAVCQAFTDAPEECGAKLSSETPSPYFGWEGTGASTTAQC